MTLDPINLLVAVALLSLSVFLASMAYLEGRAWLAALAIPLLIFSGARVGRILGAALTGGAPYDIHRLEEGQTYELETQVQVGRDRYAFIREAGADMPIVFRVRMDLPLPDRSCFLVTGANGDIGLRTMPCPVRGGR